MTPDEVPADLIDMAIADAKPGCRSDAAFYLAAVLPEHERQVRAQIADEIAARALQRRNELAPYISRDELRAYRHAARIARGDA